MQERPHPSWPRSGCANPVTRAMTKPRAAEAVPDLRGARSSAWLDSPSGSKIRDSRAGSGLPASYDLGLPGAETDLVLFRPRRPVRPPLAHSRSPVRATRLAVSDRARCCCTGSDPWRQLAESVLASKRNPPISRHRPRSTRSAPSGFQRFELRSELLRAVTEAGFTEPRPVQLEALPPALAGRDVLGLAQTGTGKTAAFALPVLQHLLEGRRRGPRALVVDPDTGAGRPSPR